ncbi:MAG TPA: PilN domain-containing protein [Methylococcus sp.]|nr:PilN domain-containing protein [Methylococcus sp.]
MLQLNQPIDWDFRSFLRWWAGELAFLVPSRVRALLDRGTPWIFLTWKDGVLEAVYRTSSEERPLGNFPADDQGRLEWQRCLEAAPELREAALVFRLLPDQCLARTVKLPAATEENLRQVMAFEMDRFTPFKADQTYFDVRVVERLKAAGQIRVELAVVPRDRLDGMLETLVAYGWQPDYVDVSDDPRQRRQQLLPERFRKPRRNWRRAINIGLAVVAASLLLLLGLLPPWKESRWVEQLENEVKKASKSAKEVESLRQQAEQLTHEIGYLLEKKRTEPIVLDVLNELSKVMPDDTWLNGLQYKDRRLIVQGQSPSASSLISRMEASPYFKNTSFVSPVTKDVSSNLERFQIASEAVNARFAETPAASEN